jgi:hypothetical protein
VFSGVFIAEEVHGVRDKGSGDTTAVDAQKLMNEFSNMSPRSACFTNETFLGKKQNFQSGDHSLQVPDYLDFQIMTSD